MANSPLFHYSAATSKGQRESNQDNLRVHLQIPRVDPDRDHACEGELEIRDTLVFAVCDGIGGALMGGIASELALDEIQRTLDTFPDVNEPSLTELARILAGAAHKRVLDYYERRRQSGGTTLTLLVVRGDMYVLLNVGDSPAFHYHAGAEQDALEELTLRHNMAGYKKLKGLEPLPGDSSLLLCFLGDPVSTPGDIAHLYLGSLEEGDRLLLCSDGITNAFSEEELTGLLGEGKTAEALVTEAAQIPYADNCTAVLLTYHGS